MQVSIHNVLTLLLCSAGLREARSDWLCSRGHHSFAEGGELPLWQLIFPVTSCTACISTYWVQDHLRMTTRCALELRHAGEFVKESIPALSLANNMHNCALHTRRELARPFCASIESLYCDASCQVCGLKGAVSCVLLHILRQASKLCRDGRNAQQTMYRTLLIICVTICISGDYRRSRGRLR